MDPGTGVVRATEKAADREKSDVAKGPKVLAAKNKVADDGTKDLTAEKRTAEKDTTALPAEKKAVGNMKLAYVGLTAVLVDQRVKDR